MQAFGSITEPNTRGARLSGMAGREDDPRHILLALDPANPHLRKASSKRQE